MRIKLNGQFKEIEDNLSVEALLQSLALEKKSLVVEHNLEILNKEDWPQVFLAAEDQVELITFMGGGALPLGDPGSLSRMTGLECKMTDLGPEVSEEGPIDSQMSEGGRSFGGPGSLSRMTGLGSLNRPQDLIARFRCVDVYPVLTPEFTLGRPLQEVAKSLFEGGAKIVQLRMKQQSKAEFFQEALDLRKLTLDYEALLLINDHIDIALAVDADGVHLGQNDLPLDAARKLLGPQKIIGISTHNRKQALEAQAQGASYINIGPIYATQTKDTPVKPLGLDLLKELSPLLNIPFTVMGGIKPKHIPELLQAGAKHLAVVTTLTAADDVQAATEQFRQSYRAEGQAL